MRLWCASRHAFRVHSLPARYRGQPQKSLDRHQDGADSRHQGHTKSYRLSGGTEPFHFEAGEKALPLYRILKNVECFTWTIKAEEALDKLKRMLTTAPILVPP